MTRWILLLLALGSILLMFFGPSPGWVALGLFGFLFGSIAATLAFAHARISSHARDKHFEMAHLSHQPTRTPRPDSSSNSTPDDSDPS